MSEEVTPEVEQNTATLSETTPDSDLSSTLGDAGKKALAEERKAKKAAELLVKEYAARIKEFEDRDKSETTKLSERAEQAEQKAKEAAAKLTELVLEREISTAAVASNALDSDAVVALIRSQVSVSDSGEVGGVSAAIADLKKRKPQLFRSPATGARDAATKASVTNGFDPNAWLRGSR